MNKPVKVIIKETPSQQVLAKANEETSVIDARGRVIKIKRPGVLSQYRLIEALGDAAKNQTYTGMVLPLIYVTAIDDLIVYQPKTKKEIEALIQLLDEDGIEAVAEHVQATFGSADPDADKAALKK